MCTGRGSRGRTPTPAGLPAGVDGAPPPLPASFRWGWAISGTESEGGGLRNQWTEWSERNAERLAAAASAGADYGGGAGTVPSWTAVAREAKDPRNYGVGRACELWSRYPADFSLAGTLGFDAAQISVEWARIEPEPGRWDPNALDHYRAMVTCLRSAGQEPFVALWHFGNPLWFEERGGWRWRGAPRAFARYTRRVVQALGRDVNFYITVVEPKVYSARSHLFGWWPPQQRSLGGFFAVLDRLVEAHRKAYAAIKQLRPQAQVGASVNDLDCLADPCSANPLDPLVARAGQNAQDWLFRNRIVDTSDWLGLNYYASRVVGGCRFRDVGPERSDIGWGLNPRGILGPLTRLGRFHKPVYITEFGVADAQDRVRLAYVDETLGAIRLARSAGVDVTGAFYWSLLDNYEWDKGYWPRFGLVEVDRDTLDRIPRASARQMRALLASHRSRGGAHRPRAG